MPLSITILMLTVGCVFNRSTLICCKNHCILLEITLFELLFLTRSATVALFFSTIFIRPEFRRETNHGPQTRDASPHSGKSFNRCTISFHGHSPRISEMLLLRYCFENLCRHAFIFFEKILPENRAQFQWRR
jgi:hypothetical protein